MRLAFPLALLLIFASLARSQDLGSPIPLGPAPARWELQHRPDVAFLFRGQAGLGYWSYAERRFYSWTGHHFEPGQLPRDVSPPIAPAPARPMTPTGGNVLPFIYLTPASSADCPT